MKKENYKSIFVMNREAKYYIKLSKLTPTICKKDKTLWPSWVYLRNTRLIYIEKSNDIIHYINIILKENHLIISTDKDDAFEKNPTSSPNKILKQTRNKRELHHPMKGIYKKIYS